MSIFKAYATLGLLLKVQDLLQRRRSEPRGLVVMHVMTRGGATLRVVPTPPLGDRGGNLRCSTHLVRRALPLGNTHLHQVRCVYARVHTAP